MNEQASVKLSDYRKVFECWANEFAQSVEALESREAACRDHPEPRTKGELSLVLGREGVQYIYWTDASRRQGKPVRLEVAPCPGRVIYSMHPPIDLKDASILSPALRVRMEKVKQGGRPYMPRPAQRLQGMCQQAFVHDEVSRGLVETAVPE